MLGTIVNTATIILGTTFGAIVRNGIRDRYKDAMFNALGLACLVLGAHATISNIPRSQYPVMFILSLSIGAVVGTRLDLSGKVDKLNARLNARQGHDANRLQGLVTGLLLYCIGTFAIVGPVLSALSPTHGWAIGEQANTYLYTNATLDLVTSAVLAATYGWIMMLAAPVLFLWQAMFYAIAMYAGDGMPEPMRCELSIVGGVLIVSSGLGILGIKDCKTVNLLPSLLVPILFYTLKELLTT